ncbi:BofC N-terminal domain-containing protein [Salibacterium sp. K-3]
MKGKSAGAAACVVLLFLSAAAVKDEQKHFSADSKNGPAQYEIILKKKTPDGGSITEKKMETVWSVEDFWQKYQNWELVDQNQDQIILQRPRSRN